MKNSLFLLLFSLFTNFSFCQTIDLEELDQYLQKTQTLWELPSMVVGIVKNDSLIFAKGYGETKVGNQTPPDKHTNYAIASNSKAFTTMLMAMLEQEDKLGWNDKVQKHLPYFEIYDSQISKLVTIEDILSHRVGLGTFSGDIMWYDSSLTAEEIVRRAKYVPQAFELRDGFGYSNVMYITAGDLIEKVTGKTWGENVSEHILQPLQMDRTVWSLSQLKTMKNVATPHATIDGENKVIRWENWDNVASTGGLLSNVEDLSKWLIFNMNHGVLNEEQLLTPANRNKIWTSHNNFTVDHTTDDVMAQNFRGYGLGFGLGEYKGKFKVSHTGGFGGMLTSITMLPDENLGIILLSNDTESPLRSIPNYIMDRFIDPEDKTDYAAQDWENMQARKKNDTRITDIEAKRIINTKPSHSISDYVGEYYSDLYGGNIIITKKNNKELRIDFEHQPNLSATLTHWHYDTYEIDWDQIQPWFDFGLVQFKTNPSNEIKGLEFTVPNYDFFFEELKPYKK